MSEFLFAGGEGHLPRAADRIARRHGAVLVNHTEPGGRQLHWFAGPNRGEPFDGRLRDAVVRELEAAGIYERALGAVQH